MNFYRHLPLLFTAACALTSSAQVTHDSVRTPSAPPTPPPAVIAPAHVPSSPSLRAAATLHDIGDPTPEEQLYIEMINRARANPSDEAALFAATTDQEILLNYQFFGVDLLLMQQQFALIPPAPPVAPSAALTQAARRHSQDMLDHSFQGHVGSDGSTFDQRVSQAGYSYSTVAENVYANADSVFHGHAGFEVDWGPGVGGMQTPPGHRNTIHSASYREVGVGVIFGQNTPSEPIAGSREVGPSLVTQEFATRQGATPLITGVAYFDLNENNFYDIGEGIGGVNVSVSDTTTQAITARSGGYAVPVSGNGTYTVTFSGPGVTTTTEEITVSSLENRKVDFRPAYTPPTITGPASPAVNSANSYSASPVPAASAYQWRSFQLVPAQLEGAEAGTTTVAMNIFGGYDPLETVIKRTGAYSFHLRTPNGAVREQSFTLNARYLATADSVLRFHSRLRWVTATTFARVLISTDDGATWTEVYSQAGSGDSGESSFQPRTVNLSSYNGSIIRIRFSFNPTGSSYIDADTGWYIDDILLENGLQISNEQLGSESATPSFSFQPTTEASFVLQARARTGHNFLPWGPMLNVQSVVGSTPPVFNLSSISIENGRAFIDVDLRSGTAPAGWTLQSKSTLTENWATASTTFEVISPARVRFNVLTRTSDSQQFYRVVTN